jgi:hypothetical protein
MQLPEFDFTDYNPKDPWHFPPQRLVHFAITGREALRVYKNKWLAIRPHPDVRFAVFHDLYNELHAVAVYAMLLRDRGLDAAWWEAQPEIGKALPQHALLANNISLRAHLQAGLLHQLVRHLDSTFRQVLRYLDREAPSTGNLGFRGVARLLLRQTGLRAYEELLTLLLALRDTAGFGGKFCPSNRKDLRVRYGGREFLFRSDEWVEGSEMGFRDTLDLIGYVIAELAGMLDVLFGTPQVMLVPEIPTRVLDGRRD